MVCARSLAALTATTAVLAGCGGSHRSSSGSHTSRPESPGAVRQPPPPIQPVYLRAPFAASSEPTTCTVYIPGFATQIIFDSTHLDVTAACREWAANQPGTGYLRGYGIAATPWGTQFCRLTDPGRHMTASVIDEAVPVTALQRATALSDCSTIVASGWIRARRH